MNPQKKNNLMTIPCVVSIIKQCWFKLIKYVSDIDMYSKIQTKVTKIQSFWGNLNNLYKISLGSSLVIELLIFYNNLF